MATTPLLRLRQICLVAPRLDEAVQQIEAVFGLTVCHRDPAVAAYGLENALFVLGHQFLEVVAPLQPGTAAGRFLDRAPPGGLAGAYMAIFDTHDPERRQAHVQALGLRVAHELRHPGFCGFQLHPRDGRATMLEFDRSDGNDRLGGAYAPAGPQWQAHQQLQHVQGLPWVDVASPEPAALAAHWARIIDVPLGDDGTGLPALRFDLGAVRFVPALDGRETLHTLHLQVADPAAVRLAAAAAGCPARGAGFVLAGVCVVPQPGAAA